MTTLSTFLAPALLALACNPAVADNKASATLYTRVEGSEVRAAIQIEIESGWHLYHKTVGSPGATGLPTVVALEASGVSWSPVRFPEPERHADPTPGEWSLTHEGTMVLHALGAVAPGGEAGTVSARITGLTCEDDGSCVPYKQDVQSAGPGPDALFAAFPKDLAVPADGATPEGGGDPEAQIEETDGAAGPDLGSIAFPEFRPRTEAEEHGLLAWLLIAFLAGMILNVMPCVLPVISIKVLSFVQQSGEDRARIFKLGVAFAAGIVVVFWVLAGLAIGAGLSWGEQFQSQAFLIAMIGIVFAFALSLFGVYELGVPVPVGQLGGTRREGAPDAFFKGMLATVLATPCSGPFLGSTLTWTLAQPPVTVVAIFTALGLGMALPYVVLTANPALLKRLPRPGPWMDTFKQAMGFVLIATVIYLMVSLRQDLLLFTAAFLVFVSIACWVWGRFARIDHSGPRRLATLVAALAIAAGGAQISFGQFRGLFQDSESHGDELPWEEFDMDRFLALLSEPRSVLVDFTADWCPNCKFNERFVYDTAEARALVDAKDVVCLKADITHDTPETRAIEELRNRLGARSIPFMAVFPADRPLEPHTRKDIVALDDFLGILRSLPDPP